MIKEDWFHKDKARATVVKSRASSSKQKHRVKPRRLVKKPKVPDQKGTVEADEKEWVVVETDQALAISSILRAI
jgi:hypothetical protein